MCFKLVINKYCSTSCYGNQFYSWLISKVHFWQLKTNFPRIIRKFTDEFYTSFISLHYTRSIFDVREYVWTCFSKCTVLFWVLPQSVLNCKLPTFFQVKWTGNIKFKCSPGEILFQNCCCNLQITETENRARFFRIHKQVRDKNYCFS